MPLYTFVTDKNALFSKANDIGYLINNAPSGGKKAMPIKTNNFDNAADIAAKIHEADPAEAASLWIDVAEDRHLAIKVHESLGEQGRIRLAEKLQEVVNKIE